jgi:peptidoglycan-N-acetylglucosamine deacetylase
MNPYSRLHLDAHVSTYMTRLYAGVCVAVARSLSDVRAPVSRIRTTIRTGRHPGTQTGRDIYLTFDDGPGVATARLLDMLAEAQGSASFFVLSSAIEASREARDLIGRMIDEGHTVGSHGRDHLDAWKNEFAVIAADQAAGFTTLETARRGARGESSAGPQGPTIWARPPYGRLTPALARWYQSHGIRVALWDVNPVDYDAHRNSRSRDDVIRYIRRAVRPGSLVLLHENCPLWEGDQANLIRALIDDGWNLRALPAFPGKEI